jgi:hypothetical protein
MAQKKANGCTVVAITPEDRYIEPDFEFFHHIKSLRSPAPDTTGTPNAAPQTAAGEAVNRV